MAQRGDKGPKGEKNGFFRKMYSSINNSSRQLAVNRQEKGQRNETTMSANGNSNSGCQPSHNSPSDGATTSSGHSGGSSNSNGGLQHFVKHHSFNGHMPFARDEAQQRNAAGDSHQSMLSKRPSLIVPFSNQQQQMGLGAAAAGGSAGGSGGVMVDGSQTYLDDFQAPISKSGVLIKQANHFKTWKKRLMVLKGHSLFYYVSGTVRIKGWA